MSKQGRQPEVSAGFAAFELAASRNSPLSVVRPRELGKVPMARGRFLMPVDGAVVIENLQIPGRRVPIEQGDAIDTFFQHNGEVYQFRSRVIAMDTPVQLNDAMMVRGMKISAPTAIERGNRRSIYRQSFASVRPAVDVSVWAVPLSVLTDDQLRLLTTDAEDHGSDLEEEGEVDGFIVERSKRFTPSLASHETLFQPIPTLTLDQARPVMQTPPHWTGAVVDASEFGLGLTVMQVVYSRLKVFQPLVVRFSLPDNEAPMEFLFETRRVQGLNKTDARLGGLMLVNAAHTGEVRSARDLARFTMDLQRDRAKRTRDVA